MYTVRDVLRGHAKGLCLGSLSPLRHSLPPEERLSPGATYFLHRPGIVTGPEFSSQACEGSGLCGDRGEERQGRQEEGVPAVKVEAGEVPGSEFCFQVPGSTATGTLGTSASSPAEVGLGPALRSTAEGFWRPGDTHRMSDINCCSASGPGSVSGSASASGSAFVSASASASCSGSASGPGSASASGSGSGPGSQVGRRGREGPRQDRHGGGPGGGFPFALLSLRSDPALVVTQEEFADVAGGFDAMAGELAYAELMVQGFERAIRRMHPADVAAGAHADVAGPGTGADEAVGKAAWVVGAGAQGSPLGLPAGTNGLMRTSSLSVDKTKMD